MSLLFVLGLISMIRRNGEFQERLTGTRASGHMCMPFLVQEKYKICHAGIEADMFFLHVCMLPTFFQKTVF